MISRARCLIARNYGTFRGSVRLALGQCEYLFGTIDGYLVPDLQSVHRLVFVCLGNINRSAFACGCASRLGVKSASFGIATSTGASATVPAIAVAGTFGIDLTAHRSMPMESFERLDGDLYLVMEIRHARRLTSIGFPSARIALLGNWANPHRIHIHDPDALSLDYYRTCFTVIHSAIRGLISEMRERGSPCAVP